MLGTSGVAPLTSGLSKQVFQLHRARGFVVPIFHDHRRVERNSPLYRLPLIDCARAWNNNRTFRNLKRPFFARPINFATYKIVKRS